MLLDEGMSLYFFGEGDFVGDKKSIIGSMRRQIAEEMFKTNSKYDKNTLAFCLSTLDSLVEIIKLSGDVQP